jgi:hypothetical protein
MQSDSEEVVFEQQKLYSSRGRRQKEAANYLQKPQLPFFASHQLARATVEKATSK